MSLVDQSMLPFQDAYPVLFVMMFLILAGNTCFVRLVHLLGGDHVLITFSPFCKCAIRRESERLTTTLVLSLRFLM